MVWLRLLSRVGRMNSTAPRYNGIWRRRSVQLQSCFTNAPPCTHPLFLTRLQWKSEIANAHRTRRLCRFVCEVERSIAWRPRAPKERARDARLPLLYMPPCLLDRQRCREERVPRFLPNVPEGAGLEQCNALRS